jgi:hypothetical protein
VQAGSLRSILEAAAAATESKKNGGKGAARGSFAATAVTVSSSCTSVADGGSAAASEDDSHNMRPLPNLSSVNSLVAMATSPSTTRFHGRTTEDRLKRR